MTKIVTWNLRAGTSSDQETLKQKRQKGLEYIEMIRQDEVIEEIKEENGKFIIYIQE